MTPYAQAANSDVTPVQAARIYSGIATGSTVPRLQLIKQIDKQVKNQSAPDIYNLDQRFLKIVKKGLEFCVEKGTGQAAKLENIKIAGKTGSAEVHSTGKTHGWFASYAPAENPEIVVVVIAEKAGHGGSIAAPIAKKIFEGYFINTLAKE